MRHDPAHAVVAQTESNQIAWIVGVYADRDDAVARRVQEQENYRAGKCCAVGVTPAFVVIPTMIHFTPKEAN